jgi:hypothetical protein
MRRCAGALGAWRLPGDTPTPDTGGCAMILAGAALGCRASAKGYAAMLKMCSSGLVFPQFE